MFGEKADILPRLRLSEAHRATERAVAIVNWDTNLGPFSEQALRGWVKVVRKTDGKIHDRYYLLLESVINYISWISTASALGRTFDRNITPRQFSAQSHAESEFEI